MEPSETVGRKALAPAPRKARLKIATVLRARSTRGRAKRSRGAAGSVCEERTVVILGTLQERKLERRLGAPHLAAGTECGSNSRAEGRVNVPSRCAASRYRSPWNAGRRTAPRIGRHRAASPSSPCLPDPRFAPGAWPERCFRRRLRPDSLLRVAEAATRGRGPIHAVPKLLHSCPSSGRVHDDADGARAADTRRTTTGVRDTFPIHVSKAGMRSMGQPSSPRRSHRDRERRRGGASACSNRPLRPPRGSPGAVFERVVSTS